MSLCFKLTLEEEDEERKRNEITVDNQQDATILFYLLLVSCACFRQYFRPSSGALCKVAFMI